MISNKALTGVTLAALAAAVLAVALPAAARGPLPEPGMMPGMMGAGRMQMLDFETLDADKDGKITLVELQAHRTAAITGADADGDGKLSADELAAAEMKLMAGITKAHANDRVKRFDSDGDGLLSVAEMAVPPLPEKMFSRIDADGDGAISKAEADAARSRMADRMEGGRRHHKPFGPGDDQEN